MGALRQGGVSVAAHPVRGSVTPPCADAVCGAFSSREEPSGQGQHAPLSYGQPRRRACRLHSVSRTARRAAEILCARGRMSFLTIRGTHPRQDVLMTRAISLRSRVPGNWQARFWRPVERGDPSAEFNNSSMEGCREHYLYSTTRNDYVDILRCPL